VKTEELRVLDVEELLGRLKSSRRELYELRFKLAVGQLDDHRQIRKVRHDIAQILTFKRQRELGLVVQEEQDVAVESAVAAAPAARSAKKTPAESTAKPAPARGGGRAEASPSTAEAPAGGVVPPQIEVEE
jgi:large subunit ribosomal protein L29